MCSPGDLDHDDLPPVMSVPGETRAQRDERFAAWFARHDARVRRRNFWFAASLWLSVAFGLVVVLGMVWLYLYAEYGCGAGPTFWYCFNIAGL